MFSLESLFSYDQNTCTKVTNFTIAFVLSNNQYKHWRKQDREKSS